MIMAGGSGTRLWPLSRANRPKQLLALINGRSLLQISGDRLAGVVANDHRLVCASSAHESQVLAAVPGLAASNFLGEPTGRDTLNAVGFAAAILAARDPDAVFAVMTSDHIIEPQSVFAQKLDLGFRLVEGAPNRFVTFSIAPTFAATGYGYVERGASIASEFEGAFHAKRFVEKPELTSATAFAKDPNFGWNSGMFVFHARTVLEAIGWFQPASAASLARIGAAWGTPQAKAIVDEVYPKLAKVSVDYGLMEPASHDKRIQICVVPMPVSWRDVGNWSSLGATLAADSDGNRSNTRTVQLDSKGMVVVSDDPNHMIATIGIEGLVVVHTRDATLICRADQAERVKELAAIIPPELR